MELSVLVLEDDTNYQGILVFVLEDAEYSAYGVSSAAEAIAAVDEAETRGEPFDIVLADVRMAGGMDGISALEIIKRRKPEMRSIVMTGYTVSRIDDPAALDAPLRAIDIEVDDYLEKPFEIKTLLTSIDNIRQRGKNPVSAWLDRFKASQDEQGRQLLRKHRYSAWNFFRVAVRSRHFVVGRIRPVLRIWDVLEEIELDYLKALNGEDEVSSIRLKELAKKYADFLFFTRQRLTAGGLLEPAPRQPGMMTPEALKGLVLKIQNEVITVEELHLAVHCWRLPPAMLGDNPFIERIHHRLWN